MEARFQLRSEGCESVVVALSIQVNAYEWIMETRWTVMVLVGISISPGIGARGEAHGSTSPGETRGAVEPAETVEQYKARMRAEVERAIATNRYPDLYGRVVDEKGQSIAGASVQFSWNDISDNGTSRTNGVSDSNGMFTARSASSATMRVSSCQNLRW